MPKKEGLGQFVDLRGGLGKKEGGGSVFEAGLIPQCTLWNMVRKEFWQWLKCFKCLITISMIAKLKFGICCELSEMRIPVSAIRLFLSSIHRLRITENGYIPIKGGLLKLHFLL